MHNFWRAIKITLRYKFTIIGIILSSLLLAVCWGGNIATVYPLVQVSFQGDTLSNWLKEKIENEEERLADLQCERAIALDNDGLQNDGENEREEYKEEIRHRIDVLNVQIDSSEKILYKYRRIQPFVDSWTPNDPFLTVVLLMLFVLFATLIKGCCTYIHSYLSYRIGQLGGRELRELFFRRMLDYETNFFSQKGISDATTRFTSDMGTLTNGIILAYGKALREPLKMIICLIGAAIVSWRLLVITLLFVPLAGLLIGWLAKSLKRVVRRAMVEMAQLYGRVSETFQGIRVVKSFNREQFENIKFCQANQTYFLRGMKTAKYDALTSPVTECLGIAALVFAILAGAYLVIYQKNSLFGIPITSRPLDLGTLILFYGFLIGASDPARRLTDIFTNIQSACAAADRVYEVIDRESLIKNCPNPKALKEFSRSFVFENISYEYPVDSPLAVQPSLHKKVRFTEIIKNFWLEKNGKIRSKLFNHSGNSIDTKENTKNPSVQFDSCSSRPLDSSRIILKNVSLEIHKGETIAIVGRSGCGKSTLLSMIPRFIDPIEGRVLIDGIPVKDVDLSDLRELIGLVSQDSILFNDTVYENIRYGRPSATKEEVINAAREAYADDFIRNELSDGYETLVGPCGGMLSGGQRQRIALARALLKDPKIFLLDEATSQIDLQSEQYIHRALKKFVKGRTTILVTHRLSAIQLADRVVVMQDGTIQFVGKHQDALKTSPFYANLWASASLNESEEL